MTSTDDLLQTAIDAARAAGDLQRQRLGTPGPIRSKQGIELVTEVDVACERLITDRIHARFPGHAILAEESGDSDASARERWIVDPLDGTTNFAHGFPVFASSVAFARDREVIAAACDVPMWHETFWAARGQGAFLNGQRLHVSEIDGLRAALLATGFPYDLHLDPRNNLAHFAHLAVRSQAVRRAGAAVVDLCCVAAGRFDGFWEFKLRPWDTAAAALVVAEAGGRVTAIDGGVWDPWAGAIVASNGRIHGELLAALAGVETPG